VSFVTEHRNEWLAKVEAAGWMCFFCGRPIQVDAEDPGCELSPDHLLPISRGGKDALCNLVPSCWRCNRMKNKRTMEEFFSARPVLCQFGLRNQQLSLLMEARAKHVIADICASVRNLSRLKAMTF
jgi:HNH endonuclease